MVAEVPVTIGNSLVKLIKTSDMIPVNLYKPTHGTSTQTLHDTSDDSNYQVPAGKVFVALQITHYQQISQAGDDIEIWESNTLDTSDGTKLIVVKSETEELLVTNVFITFAANKYVTVRPNDVGTSIMCAIFGIEMDV